MTAAGHVLRPFLDPVQLIDHSRVVADDVLAGRYPWIEFDEESRWHQRLYRDQRVDVWLISWLPAQGTELHDHGASSGSFTVVSGTLTESVVDDGRLLDRDWTAGSSVGFSAPYVHDVRNTSTQPAVSVHVYSPPLSTMNFYDLSARGRLSRIASIATDDPEAEKPRMIDTGIAGSSSQDRSVA
jgi:predicted metal-dependent enzyme (double-stranded beta helix superfamily)